MPFGININPNTKSPALQAIYKSIWPNGEPANVGFFAGLPQFLTSVATMGTSQIPNIFGSGGSNPMEVPTISNPTTPIGNLPSLPSVGYDPIKILQSLGINLGGASSNPAGNSSDILKYLLPILGGIAGGLDNRSQTTTTTPSFDPSISPLRDQTIKKYTDLLSQDPDLKGYTASGVDDLNRTSDIQKRNAEETLASRGVTGPAVATSLNSIDANRFSAINKFRQSIPLLSEQLNQQNAAAAGSFINGSPKTTTTQTSGNVLGGAVGGSTELLAYLYGLGKL